MKVKIETKIYDSNNEPIMLILDEQDKFNIGHMRDEDKKYLSYPPTISEDEARKFMEIEENNGRN